MFTMYQYWHRRTNGEPSYQWMREQIKALFNPKTDPYAINKAELYG